MQKAAYLIATFFMTQSTIAVAHLDEKVHVHATSADGTHGILPAVALLVVVASILIFRRVRRQTQRQ